MPHCAIRLLYHVHFKKRYGPVKHSLQVRRHAVAIERKAPYTMYDAQYGEFHDDGTVGTIISDGNNRYIKTCRTNETEDGSKIYKWNKDDVMINMADVRTDIVYDIYNAYSSKFFPISEPFPAIVSNSTVVVICGFRTWFSASAISSMPASSPCPTCDPG